MHSVLIDMNTIETLFFQPRILASDIKSICGVVMNNIKTKDVLLKYARRIASIDAPNVTTLTDENLIEEYAIEILPDAPSKQQNANYTIDRRIVLAMVMSADKPKGAEEEKKYNDMVSTLNKHCRSIWMPTRLPLLPETKIEPKPEILSNHVPAQKDHFDAVIPASESVFSTGTNLDQNESKIDPISTNHVPAQKDHFDAVITASESVFSTGTNLALQEANGNHFPSESKITRTYQAVNDYLIAHIKDNLLDLKSNELININHMVAATGLVDDTRNWIQNKRGLRVMKAVMRLTGKTKDELFMSIRTGPKKGTWANIYIAFDIANWICEDFGVMVYDTVMRVMRGDLSLVDDVISQHDSLNKSMTNLVSVAPAIADQVRQTTVTTVEIATAAPEQVAAQADLNNQVAAFNHKALRAIDYSEKMSPSIIYKRDPETYQLTINRGAVDKTNLERALAAIYPGEFDNDTAGTVYDLMEQMWYKIAYLQDNITAMTTATVEQKTNPDQEETITNQKNAIVNLRAHIDNLNVMHKLKPWIDSLMKPKPKARKLRTEYGDYHEPEEDGTDLGAICDLLNDVFHAKHIEQSTINHINWHMTSKIGHEYKTHVDLKHLISVVTDMTDIFRADLSCIDFKSIVNRDFANIFADMDNEMQHDQSPMYYHSLLADVETFSTESKSYDMQSSFGDSGFGDTMSNFSETNPRAPSIADPSDPYASVSIHVGARKKSSAPSRSRVVKKAHDISEELRASLTRVFEDRANATPLVVMKSRDPQSLNIYFGQEGYAFRITPRIISSVPRLILVVTLGEILEAPAFHLRPGGQITLMNTLISNKALAKLMSAKLANSRTIHDEIFMLTRDYVSSGKSILGEMVRTAVAAIGHVHVTSITYPQDQLGHSWGVTTPGDTSW